MNYLEEYKIFDYWGHPNINNSVDISPIGEGWKSSLRALANFPNGQKISRYQYVENFMTLFVALDLKKYEGKIENENLYKIAIFNEDLIELQNLGYITGVKPISEYQYDKIKYESLVDGGLPIDEFGTIKLKLTNDGVSYDFELKKTNIIDYLKNEFYFEDISNLSDEEFNDLVTKYNNLKHEFLEIEDFICVTKKGWDKLLEINNEFEIPEEINAIISPLIEIEYYSTAIREISIFLEVKLRKFHEFNSWGDKLIELHINECAKILDDENNAGLKVYRQELRSMNKFIRNEFIHNLFDISHDNFTAILFRMCELYNLMEISFEKLIANRQS